MNKSNGNAAGGPDFIDLMADEIAARLAPLFAAEIASALRRLTSTMPRIAAERQRSQKQEQAEAAKQYDPAPKLRREAGVSPVTFWRWRKLPDFPPIRTINNHNYIERGLFWAWHDARSQRPQRPFEKQEQPPSGAQQG